MTGSYSKSSSEERFETNDFVYAYVPAQDRTLEDRYLCVLIISVH